MGRVGSREIVLLKGRNDLFVKLSLHQELPKYFTSLDPKFVNHILYTIDWFLHPH